MNQFFASSLGGRTLQLRNAALDFQHNITGEPTADRANTVPDAAGEFLLDTTIGEALAQGIIIPTRFPDDSPPGPGYGPLYQRGAGILGAGPETILTVPAGYLFRLVDFLAVSQGASAGATVELYADAAPISDALDVAVDETVARAGTLDGAAVGLGFLPGTVLSLVGVNNPDAFCTIQGFFIPI